MRGWKRVNDCRLCGSPRCVVSTVNPRMAYCFRYQKTFFLSNDRQNHHVSDEVSKKKKVKENSGQMSFEFETEFDIHLRAISGDQE